MNETSATGTRSAFPFTARPSRLKKFVNLFKAKKTKKQNTAELSQPGETLPANVPHISREQENAWASRMEKNIEREMKAFRRLLPELLKDEQGKFAAISQGKVIAVDVNEYNLVEKVTRENGGKFVLIQEVTAKAFDRLQT